MEIPQDYTINIDSSRDNELDNRKHFFHRFLRTRVLVITSLSASGLWYITNSAWRSGLITLTRGLGLYAKYLTGSKTSKLKGTGTFIICSCQQSWLPKITNDTCISTFPCFFFVFIFYIPIIKMSIILELLRLFFLLGYLMVFVVSFVGILRVSTAGSCHSSTIPLTPTSASASASTPSITGISDQIATHFGAWASPVRLGRLKKNQTQIQKRQHGSESRKWPSKACVGSDIRWTRRGSRRGIWRGRRNCHGTPARPNKVHDYFSRTQRG